MTTYSGKTQENLYLNTVQYFYLNILNFSQNQIYNVKYNENNHLLCISYTEQFSIKKIPDCF